MDYKAYSKTSWVHKIPPQKKFAIGDPLASFSLPSLPLLLPSKVYSYWHISAGDSVMHLTLEEELMMLVKPSSGDIHDIISRNI